MAVATFPVRAREGAGKPWGFREALTAPPSLSSEFWEGGAGGGGGEGMVPPRRHFPSEAGG